MLLTTRETFGPTDILVSNLGYLPNIEPIATANIDELFEGFEVNVKGNLSLAQALLANLFAKPTLVRISTGGAHAPASTIKAVVYATSKVAAAKPNDYIVFANPHVRVMTVHHDVLASGMNDKAMAGGLVLTFDDGEPLWPEIKAVR